MTLGPTVDHRMSTPVTTVPPAVTEAVYVREPPSTTGPVSPAIVTPEMFEIVNVAWADIPFAVAVTAHDPTVVASTETVVPELPMSVHVPTLVHCAFASDEPAALARLAFAVSA